MGDAEAVRGGILGAFGTGFTGQDHARDVAAEQFPDLHDRFRADPAAAQAVIGDNYDTVGESF